MKKQISLGGQALVEGVMMKTPTHLSAAARTPRGTIVRTKRRHVALAQRNWFCRLPVIRGAVSLGEMLVVGIQMLNWSANQQAESAEEKLGWLETSIALLLSLGLTIVLFIIAPYYLARMFAGSKTVLFNLIDGVLRVLIFIGYLAFITVFKDVRRMFQYHGAEHMAVHCYEAGKALRPENVQRYNPVHPRCGTSLLMFVIIVSILVFSLVKDPRWYVNVPLRIVLIPVIAGISYELLKMSARWPHNILLKALMQPGLWVQKITTSRPDRKQIEVAIAALKEGV